LELLAEYPGVEVQVALVVSEVRQALLSHGLDGRADGPRALAVDRAHSTPLLLGDLRLAEHRVAHVDELEPLHDRVSPDASAEAHARSHGEAHCSGADKLVGAWAVAASPVLQERLHDLLCA